MLSQSDLQKLFHTQSNNETGDLRDKNAPAILLWICDLYTDPKSDNHFHSQYISAIFKMKLDRVDKLLSQFVKVGFLDKGTVLKNNDIIYKAKFSNSLLANTFKDVETNVDSLLNDLNINNFLVSPQDELDLDSDDTNQNDENAISEADFVLQQLRNFAKSNVDLPKGLKTLMSDSNDSDDHSVSLLENDSDKDMRFIPEISAINQSESEAISQQINNLIGKGNNGRATSSSLNVDVDDDEIPSNEPEAPQDFSEWLNDQFYIHRHFEHGLVDCSIQDFLQHTDSEVLYDVRSQSNPGLALSNLTRSQLIEFIDMQHLIFNQ